MPKREIQAIGPWVLVDPTPFLKKTKGGIYRPDGNMEDRLGYAEGIVDSVGKGKYIDTKKKGRVFEHPGVAPGDRVIFRGFLKEANQPVPFEDDRCFIHQDDLLGKWEN
jgi:co-chaperonin GroES (HSP10)